MVKNKVSFEADLRYKMAVMNGYLKIEYEGAVVDGKANLLVPFSDYSVYQRELDMRDYF